MTHITTTIWKSQSMSRVIDTRFDALAVVNGYRSTGLNLQASIDRARKLVPRLWPDALLAMEPELQLIALRIEGVKDTASLKEALQVLVKYLADQYSLRDAMALAWKNHKELFRHEPWLRA